ncbi:hypothetical protein N0O92_16485 [Alkalihalobacillus sp. MEB130]|uniref:hypothetical protein n=1 Tax=Alkalihalobacillus sp. MEB130 TaxID=2976704 RepID=UPI0028DE9C55|nr:hypothetical protein [Alkalihalobacillus sp. MEB130]MDT8861812.1 hypothetical protein [Alkalihalobacillus sp. MEB130]
MPKLRTMYVIKEYTPCPTKENDEIFPNGVFHFNISNIVKDIYSGKLLVYEENINVKEWFCSHLHSTALDENHLPTVDIERPIIQAEIRPNFFSIIDGNHRIEKAYRTGVPSIRSYKIVGEQLIPYIITTHGYRTFVEYWNSKL